MGELRSKSSGPADAQADPPMLGDLVRQHLPAMRRFARAALGGQRAGDLWVEAALRRVVEGAVPIDETRVKAGLLSALVTTTPPGHDPPSNPAVGTVENEAILVDRLGQLAVPERLLLLLVDLEGLALHDAAQVLGLEAGTAAEQLAEGREALRRQPARRVMIVEDESVIALDLAETVTSLGHEVVAIAATYRQALAEAERTGPTLILADIQLADDSSGIDVVNDLLAKTSLPVVFITAFPERLLTGTRPEPTFLITKPFDRDMLAVALAQAIVTSTPDA